MDVSRINDRTEVMAWQHLNAGHDTNGNPRRCFVIYSKAGNIIDVVDEGYSGRPGWLDAFPQLPGFAIKPGEYRELLKLRAIPA